MCKNHLSPITTGEQYADLDGLMMSISSITPTSFLLFLAWHRTYRITSSRVLWYHLDMQCYSSCVIPGLSVNMSAYCWISSWTSLLCCQVRFSLKLSLPSNRHNSSMLVSSISSPSSGSWSDTATPAIYEFSLYCHTNYIFLSFEVLLQQVSVVDCGLGLHFHLVVHSVDDFFDHIWSSPLYNEFIMLCRQKH